MGEEGIYRQDHVRFLAQDPPHFGQRDVVPVRIEAEVFRVSRLVKLAYLDQVMAVRFELRYELLPVRETLRAELVVPLLFAGRDYDSHTLSPSIRFLAHGFTLFWLVGRDLERASFA